MRMPNLGIVMAESRFRVRGVILEHDAGRRDRAVHFSIVLYSIEVSRDFRNDSILLIDSQVGMNG